MITAICVQIACKFFLSLVRMDTSIKISLDKRRQKKDGSYPIILRLSHFRKTTSINLGLSISEEFWDDKNERIKKSYKGTSSVSKLNNRLLKEKIRAVDIFNDLYEKDKLDFLSVLQLKSRIWIYWSMLTPLKPNQ